MNYQEFRMVANISERPPNSWTLEEEDKVYWWYFHEVEVPSEEQLWFCAKRYITGNYIKWYTFLLQCFPSEENMSKVFDLLNCGVGFALRKVLKGMLCAVPLSQTHIDLAQKYGSRSIRRKAKKIASRQYEI